jgi:hypothetical protein
MAASYAIVYATASKMHRRTIADDEGQISLGTMPDGTTPAVIVGHSLTPPSLHPLLPGESALIQSVPPNAVSADGYPQWISAIQTATGVAPPQLTCALIDGTNTVQQLVAADPAIDSAPAGFTIALCYSPLITIGCTFNPATGLFTAPAFTIPAGTPGDKGTALPKTVPATVIPKP